MKTKVFFVALFCVFFAVSSFAGNKTVLLNVPMHCESCQKKIEKNIAFEKGVKDLVVNLNGQTVSVTYDEAKTNIEKIKAAFKKIGYEATLPGEKPVGKPSGEMKSCGNAM